MSSEVPVSATWAPTYGFSPSWPLPLALRLRRLAAVSEVTGLARVVAHTTPAVRDIGAASVCIEVEDGSALPEEGGGCLVALRPLADGSGAWARLPAIAGVPGRHGLDRHGVSRLGKAEVMLLARPLVGRAGAKADVSGRVTCLPEDVLQRWLPVGSTVELVLLAKLTDFFLGMNAGTWLKIRIADIVGAAETWAESHGDPGDEEAPVEALLEGSGLKARDAVEDPPGDASELWQYWGGGGNTGASGQVTLPDPVLEPAAALEVKAALASSGSAP